MELSIFLTVTLMQQRQMLKCGVQHLLKKI